MTDSSCSARSLAAGAGLPKRQSRPLSTSCRRYWSGFIPSGTSKGGSRVAPRFSFRSHWSATSSVLASASGMSANASIISYAVFCLKKKKNEAAARGRSQTQHLFHHQQEGQRSRRQRAAVGVLYLSLWRSLLA